MNIHRREVYASSDRNLSILIVAQAEFDASIDGSPSIIPTSKHVSEQVIFAERQIKFKRWRNTWSHLIARQAVLKKNCSHGLETSCIVLFFSPVDWNIVSRRRHVTRYMMADHRVANRKLDLCYWKRV